MADLVTTNASGQIVSTAVILPTGAVTSEDGGGGLADIDTSAEARSLDITAHTSGASNTPYGPDLAIRHRNTLLQIISRGIGAALTTVNEDGDLSLIDTAAERQTANPLAHAAGASSARWSLTSLFRWFLGITQDVTEATHVRVGLYETYVQLGDLTVAISTDTVWTPLPSFAASKRVDVMNISDTPVRYRRVGTTTPVNTLIPGASVPLSFTADAAEIEFRSTTTATGKQVSVHGITIG